MDNHLFTNIMWTEFQNGLIKDYRKSIHGRKSIIGKAFKLKLSVDEALNNKRANSFKYTNLIKEKNKNKET